MKAILVVLAAAALSSCATVRDVVEACTWNGACLVCEPGTAGEFSYCPPADVAGDGE